MKLVKIFLAAFAVSTVVSFTVALVRTKRHVNNVSKEIEEEFLKTAQDLRCGAQRAKREAELNSARVKEDLTVLNKTEQAMDAVMGLLEDSVLDQPAIKVGGKNKVDPLEFAKSINPEDILPV